MQATSSTTLSNRHQARSDSKLESQSTYTQIVAATPYPGGRGLNDQPAPSYSTSLQVFVNTNNQKQSNKPDNQDSHETMKNQQHQSNHKLVYLKVSGTICVHVIGNTYIKVCP